MSFIVEPTDQIVLNTPLFQSSFENDTKFGISSSAPASVYLSRLINLNLDYLLEPNEISAQIIGFDPIFTSVSSSNLVTMSITKGVAIVDKTLIEFTQDISIDIDGNFLFNAVDPTHNDNIILVVDYEFKNSVIQNDFKIKAYLIDSSSASLIPSSPGLTWDNNTHNFVLGVLKIYRNTDASIAASDLAALQNKQTNRSDCITLFTNNINKDILTSLVLETGDNINFGSNPGCGPNGLDTIPFEILDIINVESVSVTQDLINKTSLELLCLNKEVTSVQQAVNTDIPAKSGSPTGTIASVYVKCSVTEMNINNTKYSVLPRTNVYNHFKGLVSTK